MSAAVTRCVNETVRYLRPYVPDSKCTDASHTPQPSALLSSSALSSLKAKPRKSLCPHSTVKQSNVPPRVWKNAARFQSWSSSPGVPVELRLFEPLLMIYEFEGVDSELPLQQLIDRRRSRPWQWFERPSLSHTHTHTQPSVGPSAVWEQGQLLLHVSLLKIRS